MESNNHNVIKRFVYQTTRQVSLFIDSLHIPGDEDEAELVVEEADEGVERHIDGVVSEGLQGEVQMTFRTMIGYS